MLKNETTPTAQESETLEDYQEEEYQYAIEDDGCYKELNFHEA